MERRDFLKAIGATGGLAALPSACAIADAGLAPNPPGTRSGRAFAHLLATLEESQERYLSREYGIERQADVADGHRFLLHVLEAGLVMHLEADPRRPAFKRIVSPTMKLLGDNPDAVYSSATIDPVGIYRIRGNTAGAVYVSLTIEDGSRDGSYPSGTSATLNSDEFQVDADGNFTVLLSSQKQEGDWMELGPNAGTVTTRHYFEDAVSVAKQADKSVPLQIERIDGAPAPPTPSDASISNAITRVANYVHGQTIGQPPRHKSEQPAWVSKLPNHFNPPEKPGNMGFAAVDNAYTMAPYLLMPGHALVIEGRFPKCRFSNVVLWNRYLQSYDYANRNVSLNRKQTQLDSQGRYKIVLAAQDPGLPNWIDTEGRPSGIVYWRFLLPEGDIETPVGTVVPIETLRS